MASAGGGGTWPMRPSANGDSRPFGIDDSLARTVAANEAEKARSTFILYDRREHCLAFGADARLLAERVFQSESVIRSMTYGASRTPVVYVSDKQYVRVVRDVLLRLQRRLEVWKQADTGRWAPSAKGSPGNLGSFDELLANEQGEQCVDAAGGGRVIALRTYQQHEQQCVALACIDLAQFTLTVDQFSDGSHFTNLESALVQLAPHECLSPPYVDMAANRKANVQLEHPLTAVLQRTGAFVSPINSSDYNSTNVLRDLDWLLRLGVRGAPQSAAQCPESSLEHAMCCVSALFSYLSLKSQSHYESKFAMRRMDNAAFMRLDANAVRALELFNTTYLEKDKGSLYSLLNKCRTAGGQRLLNQWIRQPLIDKHKIEERLDVVCALMHSGEVRSRLHDELLRRVPDLPRLLKRLVKGKALGATLADCYKLYGVVNVLPPLLHNLHMLVERTDASSAKSSINELIVAPIQEFRRALMQYGEMVESTIDIDHLQQTKEYRIKPSVDKDLSLMADTLSNIKEDTDALLYEAAARLCLEAGKSIKLDSIPGDSGSAGYYYRIVKRDEACLRKCGGFAVFDATRGGVRFSDERLRSLNARLAEARRDYDLLQADFVQQVVQCAAGYFAPMSRCAGTLATLDVLTALAVNAAHASRQYVRPVLLDCDAGELRLSECRHASMETLPGVDFIGNDVELVKGSHSTVIVTGANMGGKSTLLRSVGLCVVMAQIGSPVPASSARISIRDAVHARVGAGDCETRNVSTFMAEMIDCAVILEAAGQRSLVLVDELGRGTSTYDGFGLAAMITQRIATKLGSLSLVATHFHELSLLACSEPTVRNMHMAAAVVDGHLTMLYKLKHGACSQSFGIHVAKAVGFPDTVVEDAGKQLAELEESSDTADSAVDGAISVNDLAHLCEVARSTDGLASAIDAL